jgi:hypothetical protein
LRTEENYEPQDDGFLVSNPFGFPDSESAEQSEIGRQDHQNEVQIVEQGDWVIVLI